MERIRDLVDEPAGLAMRKRLDDDLAVRLSM